MMRWWLMWLRWCQSVAFICAELAPTKAFSSSNSQLGTGKLILCQLSLTKLYKNSFKQMVPWQPAYLLKDIHPFRWRRPLIPQLVHHPRHVSIGALVGGLSVRTVIQVFVRTQGIGGLHQWEGCDVWHAKQHQQHHRLTQTQSHQRRLIVSI